MMLGTMVGRRNRTGQITYQYFESIDGLEAVLSFFLIVALVLLLLYFIWPSKERKDD